MSDQFSDPNAFYGIIRQLPFGAIVDEVLEYIKGFTGKSSGEFDVLYKYGTKVAVTEEDEGIRDNEFVPPIQPTTAATASATTTTATAVPATATATAQDYPATADATAAATAQAPRLKNLWWANKFPLTYYGRIRYFLYGESKAEVLEYLNRCQGGRSGVFKAVYEDGRKLALLGDVFVEDEGIIGYEFFPEDVPTATAAAAVQSDDDGLSRFWAAIVKPGSVTLDGKKLRFANGAVTWGWSRRAHVLYVRDCYVKAIETLRGARIAMIDGTPGIGKTMFIFYFIYAMVTQSRENGEGIPTFIIRDCAGTNFFLTLDATGNGIVVSDKDKDILERPDYRITKNFGECYSNCRKQYIHVVGTCSRSTRDVKRLMEDDARHGRHLRFPVFSWDEYRDLDGGGDANETDMLFYYDVFGGSLRNLRSAATHSGVALSSDALQSSIDAVMTSFFGSAELVGVSEATWSKTARELVNELMPLTFRGSFCWSLIFHWIPCEPYRNRWEHIPATRFMRHLVGYICDSAPNDALHSVKGLLGSSGMRYVHEYRARRFRLQHLGESPGLTLWSLANKQDRRSLRLDIRRVVRIRTVDDIKLLRDGDYGLPTVSNFPFLDGVMKPNYIFRDTIAAKTTGHPSSVAMKIPEILEALGTNDPMLIHTLSANDFESFKASGSKSEGEDELRPFSQWKARMEIHAGDLAMSAAPPPVARAAAAKKRARSTAILTSQT